MFNGANFSDEYGHHVFSNQSHYRWDRRRGKRRKHDSDPDSALGPTRGSLQFLSVISDGSDVFIPPSLRVKPSWYPRFRPVILQTMLQLLGSRPSNLQILQDFSSDLEPDGIHFSIMGGVTFVQDLHDQSLALMSQPPPDIVLR